MSHITPSILAVKPIPLKCFNTVTPPPLPPPPNPAEMGSTTDVLFNLYCRLRDAGQPVSLKLWSTEGQQFFNFSLLPSSNLEPQRQWQINNPHKPLKYKSPCRRRRDLNRLEQRRAQGAGYQVQGAGDHVQGAGDQVRGAGDQVHISSHIVYNIQHKHSPNQKHNKQTNQIKLKKLKKSKKSIKSNKNKLIKQNKTTNNKQTNKQTNKQQTTNRNKKIWNEKTDVSYSEKRFGFWCCI